LASSWGWRGWGWPGFCPDGDLLRESRLSRHGGHEKRQRGGNPGLIACALKVRGVIILRRMQPVHIGISYVFWRLSGFLKREKITGISRAKPFRRRL
jgi:hypothetical protein